MKIELTPAVIACLKRGLNCWPLQNDDEGIEIKEILEQAEELEAEQKHLDSRDFAAGYFAGFNGYGHEPLGEIDTTYYHGQLMGMDDKGRMQPSATYKQLVHEWHERSKKENT